MKIWIQSGTAIGQDPEMSSYDQSLKRRVQEVARPDTLIDIHGIKEALPRPDRYYLSEHIQTSWLVENALQAQRGGYDAFVVVCTLDPAFHEIKEVLDIPAVFMLETSLHLASLLAPKFAFLAHNEAMLLRLTQKVKEYGLGERMTPGECLNLTHKDFNDMYANPKPYLDALISKGKRIVEQGANILLVSGTSIHLFLFEHGVREIDGVPILEVCGAVVKFGEYMVDLKNIGVARSKMGLDSAPSKGELATILNYFKA